MLRGSDWLCAWAVPNRNEMTKARWEMLSVPRMAGCIRVLEVLVASTSNQLS